MVQPQHSGPHSSTGQQTAELDGTLLLEGLYFPKHVDFVIDAVLFTSLTKHA